MLRHKRGMLRSQGNSSIHPLIGVELGWIKKSDVRNEGGDAAAVNGKICAQFKMDENADFQILEVELCLCREGDGRIVEGREAVGWGGSCVCCHRHCREGVDEDGEVLHSGDETWEVHHGGDQAREKYEAWWNIAFTYKDV